ALTSTGGLNVTTGGALTGVSSLDTITTTATSLGFANAGTISTGNNNNFTITPNGTGNIILTSTATSGVRVGSSSNTPAVLSVSGGIGSNASFIVNNVNNGDLFTASSSGTTEFTIANNGTIKNSLLPNVTNTYDLGSSSLQWNNVYANNIYSNGVQLSQLFQLNSGALSPFNITNDLLLGGTATSTAKFAFINNSGAGTPTASISAQTAGGPALSIAANGAIQTYDNAPLTLGGGSTGIINFYNTNNTLTPGGALTIAGNLTANGTVFSLGNGSAATINTPSGNANLTIAPNGTGTLNLATSNTGAVNIGNSTGAFTLTSSGGLNVTNTGALTGVSSLDTITTTATSLGFANAGTISTGNNNNFTITPNGTGNTVLTTTAVSGVRVGGSGNTPAVLSVSGGIANNGAFIVNNLNSGDLIDASASGTTEFSVTNGGSLSLASNAGIDSITSSGTINVGTGANTSTLVLGKSGGTTQLAELTTNGVVYTSGGNGTLNSEAHLATSRGGTGQDFSSVVGGSLIYFNGTGTMSTFTQGSTGQALISNGDGTFSWTAVATGFNPWTLLNNAIVPKDNQYDLLLGGQSTASAKFAFINNSGAGTPTASISAQTAGGPALSIAANGAI
ncbi:MAG: hypothetical protein KGL95_06415, partial [Patescibacteria group bacterium]|nr:hypothetical protein [Patescibacteria group bacterium]